MPRRRGRAAAGRALRPAVALLLLPGLACALGPGRLWSRPQEASVPVLVEKPPAGLEAPASLRAVSGELRAIPLQWDPVLTGDVAGYVVERTFGENGSFQRIGIVADRFDTAFTDEGRDLADKPGSTSGAGDLGDGNAYRYRVRSFDGEGRVAADASPTATATTAAVPVQPTGLTAYSSLPRQVALSWNPVTDPTVSGYVVYRSPTARGGFQPRARLSGRFETAWVDRGLGALRVFYYRVAAVNGAGGEGEATPAARAVTKPEPLPPTGLAVRAQRLGANELGWEPNVEPDLSGYRLQRRRGTEEAEELVATTQTPLTAAEDPAVGSGERVAYRVLAFDRDGLESAPSDWLEVESVDYGLRGDAYGGAVHLHWDPAVQAQFEEMQILLEGALRPRELARVRSEGFVHREVEPGKRYRYRVVGLPADGPPGPPSRIVDVVVPR